jgi:hypothetical protein
MRANEFIDEGKNMGKMKKNAKNVSQGVWTMRDDGGYDRTYHLNRIMMAAAMSDGSDKPVEMDPSSWIEKYNTAHPYTEIEHGMMKAAFKTVPSEIEHQVKDHKSKEPDDTHTVSPVPDRGKLTK